MKDSASARFEGLTPVGRNAQEYREWKHHATGIVLVELPGGEFDMGSPEIEPDRGPSEILDTVTLSLFLIGKYEVTQAVMGSNPSYFKGNAQRPVEPAAQSQQFSPRSRPSAPIRSTVGVRLPRRLLGNRQAG